uniref:Uncharacterized protein n=1 Tax=Strongyloides venezuelensis TaxID=75913 RepID=A0A0K0F150_STRVS
MCNILRTICTVLTTIVLLFIIFYLTSLILLLFFPEETIFNYADKIIYKIYYFLPYDVYKYFTGTKNIYNIFDIEEQHGENSSAPQSFTYFAEDVDGFFVYYMNTSERYTETNIIFKNEISLFNSVLCTYCTLQQFIERKNLHMVNLFGVPIRLYYMIKSAYSYKDVCLDTFNGLDREHCPKKSFMANRINVSEHFIPDKVKPFWKPKYASGINCKRIFDGDKKYVEKIKDKPIKYQEEKLKMDCASIKQRSFNLKYIPTSPLERKYSLAFAYNVYKAYPILERRLSSQYSPNNHYCYFVDIKSPEVYKQLQQLEKCIPNVYVVKKQYNMTSGGDYATLAHVECMKLLLKKKWNYLYLQQNDDFPLKTPRQQLEILESMNFPVEMSFVDPSSTVPFRYNTSLSWNYKDLNFFFKDDYRNKYTSKLLEKIVFQKGSVCTGLPRESVEYLVKKINLTTYLNQMNVGIYGNDELAWQTLFTDDFLNIPGSIPRKCVHIYRPRESYLVRKVIWEPEECPTKTYHHSICTWGTETLPEIESYPDFYGYRFRGETDYGAEVCWMEHLYNITHFKKHKRRDLWYYYNLPQSVFQRLRIKNDVEAIRNCEL